MSDMEKAIEFKESFEVKIKAFRRWLIASNWSSMNWLMV